MKVLILGGTQFLGRTIAEIALANGHELTLFNRGNTNADLFPDVEKLTGDRDGDLKALEGRTWDVCIDTCGYVPRIVKDSAELLKDSVEHYTFISSISVYGPPMDPNLDESGPVQTIEDETVEQVTGETYGALKALCEQAAEAAMPGRVLNVRAGLIVGPYDPTDRFTYHPVKVARGGDTLVPPLNSHLQVIDVRDLSGWILRMAESRSAGVYNATGPDSPLTFKTVLEACNEAGGNKANLIEASEEFLLENEVAPWQDIPLWLPDELISMHSVNVSKVINDGMTYRPIADTIRDTLAWYTESRGLTDPLKTGMPHEREAQLLAMLKQQSAE